MIAFVQGRVAALAPEQVVVDVGGIGLALQCTPSTLAGLRVGAQARVPASLVVREDSLTLYGFADDDERAIFELLQTASGVGPRLAQAMLAVHGPDDLRRAVVSEDYAALTRVPGIGRKGAQRIVLELKDRLGPAPVEGLAADGHQRSGAEGAGWQAQVRAALVGLGWSGREADEAVAAVVPLAAGPADGADPQHAPAAVDIPSLLKAALRTLDRS